MPLFRDRRAILVHVPKTGGQTVEAVLGCSYAAADLYGVDGDRELSHLTAAEIMAAEPDLFAAWFKFGFVRNPWDRMVSEYAFTRGDPWYLRDQPDPADPSEAVDAPETPESAEPVVSTEPVKSFGEFVAAVAAADPASLTHVRASHLRPQAEYLLDAADRPLVDFVGRFESFEPDLRAVCGMLGLGAVEVPRINTTDHAHYASYYTDETVSLVGRLYARDVRAFGYEFGS